MAGHDPERHPLSSHIPAGVRSSRRMFNPAVVGPDFWLFACKQNCRIPKSPRSCAIPLYTGCLHFAILGGGVPAFCRGFPPEVIIRIQVRFFRQSTIFFVTASGPSLHGRLARLVAGRTIPRDIPNSAVSSISKEAGAAVVGWGGEGDAVPLAFPDDRVKIPHRGDPCPAGLALLNRGVANSLVSGG
jgi:hypothetical protein